MKFSVITIYPPTNSTLKRCDQAQYDWESLVLAVEYLFMGFGSRIYGELRLGDSHDFEISNIIGINSDHLLRLLEKYDESGRYRPYQTVPI